MTDLTDDEPRWAHAKRLFHQPSDRDFAFALQIGLASLHADHVWQAQLKLEDLLDGDHALASRNRRAEGVQHRRLAGLGAAGHKDVQAGNHAGLQESRSLLGYRAE